MKTLITVVALAFLLGVVIHLNVDEPDKSVQAQTKPSSNYVLPTAVETRQISGLPSATAAGKGLQDTLPVPEGTTGSSSLTVCGEFTDVATTAYYYPAVQYLNCKGYVSGYTSSQCTSAGVASPCFLPNSNVLRGQFTKFLVGAFGWKEKTPASGSTFTDVPTSNAFFKYVETAYSYGVIGGFNAAQCTTLGVASPCFGPDVVITRGQMSKVITLAAGYSVPTPSSQRFSDVASTYFAYGYVEAVYNNGVISGFPPAQCVSSGTPTPSQPCYKPESSTTRADTSKIVYNASNGSSGGLFGHCCRTTSSQGQYEGSNNMIYNYTDPNSVSPIIPGGKMIGSARTSSQIVASAKDILWEPTAVAWLKANTTSDNYVPTIVFHARKQGPEGCGNDANSNGSWISTYVVSNLPNPQFFKKAECSLRSENELRIYPYDVNQLQSNTRYIAEGVWESTDSVPYDGFIDISNYQMQRDTLNNYTAHKDSMNKFCYTRASGTATTTWCRN